MKLKNSGVLFVVASTLVSCAGTSKHHSFHKDAEVSSVRVFSSGMPNYILPEKIEAKKFKNINARMPASIMVESKLDHKEMYFFSLFSQYHFLRNSVARADELKVCPQFHHQILTHPEYNYTSVSGVQISSQYNEEVFKTRQNVAIFPELSMPVEHGDNPALVYEEVRAGEDANEQVFNALNIQYEKTKIELEKMCDKGTSDSFFAFSNFINYAKNNPGFVEEANSIKSLLKIPIFSNHYLIGMMSAKHSWESTHYLSLTNHLYSKLYEAVDMPWAKIYVHAQAKYREQFNGVYSLYEAAK